MACLALPGSAVAQAGLSEAASQDGDTAEQGAPLDALLKVLKDPEARDTLIAELEQATADAGSDEEPAAGPDILSFGSRIATATQTAVEDTAAALISLRDSVTDGRSVFDGLDPESLNILVEALPGLGLIILSTVALFVLLRWFAGGFYRSLGVRAAGTNVVHRVGLYAGSVLVDVLIVLLAWALGYVVALFVLGVPGQIGFRQALYLNAFLFVELLKVALRAVLSPAVSEFRIVPVSDRAAGALTRYSSVVVSILGYGHLLVVPIVNRSASPAAGAAVSAILSVIVLVYLVYVVLRRRREVARWLEAAADPERALHAAAEEESVEAQEALDDRPAPSPGPVTRTLAAISRYWHWAALAYLAGMFVVVMTQSDDRTFAALIASGKILVAVVFAALLSGWLARAVARGVSLPGDMTDKLPLLEDRLNRVMPRVFAVLRLVLAFLVVVFALATIGVLDIGAWLKGGAGLSVTTTLMTVAAILLVAFALWLALTSFVDYKLNPEYGTVPTARETTLLTLLRNAATIALMVLTLMFVLSEIGLDIGPLLASAGVLGLAIGFGSQKLVQDIINGVFIQFENAINVGDVVTASGTTGVVERLSIRSVSLRDVHGVYHIVPFSSVDLVSNFMKEFSYFVCDMGIAYREDVDEAKEAMHAAFAKLREDPEIARDIVDELEWFGLNSFGDNAVVLRARIKTIPGKQWGVGRAYNAVLKQVFDERGIEIPFPQRTIWLGEAKDGSSQALRIAAAEGDFARKPQDANQTAPSEEVKPRDYDAPESPGDDR
ncbi:mechanosensitive ion channel [Sulfitobacter sp. D35]|uniref:mechanosensitive ion channel domain-containing protein n=1 Tax=Sulfitobacter sp. D35 TaxID=3083252 RepID=UPI00296ED094|nr:mechanosensitive ion channel domain-containing protein [Sulfitobacter sp. D35]MDW4496728.1 mechanosensitive ion channel [Sulfitobacter sp. D35]